jgi:hypothetical protein
MSRFLAAHPISRGGKFMSAGNRWLAIGPLLLGLNVWELSSGSWAVDNNGSSLLDGRRRLDVLRKTPADYPFFRFVWSEIRGKLAPVPLATISADRRRSAQPTGGNRLQCSGVGHNDWDGQSHGAHPCLYG